MSPQTLEAFQREDLISHKFKYVGFAASAFGLIYAFTHHFIAGNLLFDGLHAPKMIFTAGLIISVFSEEASEDERVNQVRLQVFYILTSFFIGIIFLNELEGDPRPIILDLSALLTVYLIFFHLFNYLDVEWILGRRGMFWFIVGVLLITLYIFYDILWSI